MEIVELNPELCEQYAPEISEYIYQSFAESQYNASFTLERAKEKCAELRDYLAQGRACAFGAIDGTLIGFIWSYRYPFRDDENRVYVSILHVDKRYRNRHIGERLLCAVERKAAESGCHTLFLHTEARNSGAIRFYERMGYQMERLQMVKIASGGGGYNVLVFAISLYFSNFSAHFPCQFPTNESFRAMRVIHHSEVAFPTYGKAA